MDTIRASALESGEPVTFLLTFSVGDLFGEILAAQAVELFDLLGAPGRFKIAEQGAEKAQLAKDIRLGAGWGTKIGSDGHIGLSSRQPKKPPIKRPMSAKRRFPFIGFPGSSNWTLSLGSFFATNCWMRCPVT